MIHNNTIKRPIWIQKDSGTVQVIDQRRLPHELKIMDLTTVGEVVFAIREMVVRGAPLIGATGAIGVYIALNEQNARQDDSYIEEISRLLKESRPTAMNLFWGVNRVKNAVLKEPDHSSRKATALKTALKIIEEEVENCQKIGKFGAKLIHEAVKKNETVNILTHCNAGWLACIEYGTATAPIYAAFDQGIDIHVWVDETRPLNQGARLTAWELSMHNIPHTVITDNAGGHLMQHGLVDMVIVGTDRTSRTGDVANKIGTYLKALAAKDNNIPFYVALPSSTFDWSITDGIRDIPIEERNPDEVRLSKGLYNDKILDVMIPPKTTPCSNPAFDVTPSRLVTSFITERGICKANETDIINLFPEKR